MKHMGHVGFLLSSEDVRRDVLIPRYYDPELRAEIDALAPRFHLKALSELIKDGEVIHSHGDYVPKIHYGTGPYPYVRTSDLANWEIKASPKHGVPKEVFDDYSISQQVRSEDILFVHEGTYLIGSVAMVTEYDGPMLYQHHLAKFSVNKSAPFNAYYLLVAFESPLVSRQIRSKQFSADIIDSVVGRLEEVVIPYPKDAKTLRRLELQVEEAVTERARLRRVLADSCVSLDDWLRGDHSAATALKALNSPIHESERQTAFLGGRRGFTSSLLPARNVLNDVLLPRYYDPVVEELAPKYGGRCNLESVSELVSRGLLSVDTGDEIGRLNYGTGSIPFVRTSDFGSWELKRESKQGVSQEVFDAWAANQDIKPDDILLVRDGTYLVGTSILVSEADLPLLFCGGIYRIRSLDHSALPPALLFALLNSPFVRRQIRNKQFTRDVIDTLGQRLFELVLPLPKSKQAISQIAEHFGHALGERARFRTRLHRVSQELFATS